MTSLFASAFNLHNDDAYQQWKAAKMQYCLPSVEQIKVKINDVYNLGQEERRVLLNHCARFNVAIYQLQGLSPQKKNLVSVLGSQLGLNRLDANLRSDEDAISSLQISNQAGNQYIPYTNKALSWHTDGYYNKPACQINAIIMHCVSNAVEGGVNQLIDHEFIYMKLRDEDPAYIEALMHSQAMTIPANTESGKEIRAAQSGPVFSLHKLSGRLHMRYSARKRNIIWRNDEATHEAVARLNAMLVDDSLTISVALKPGQGIICNNVLHNRSGFKDSVIQQRLMYRARYYDRVESENNMLEKIDYIQ